MFFPRLRFAGWTALCIFIALAGLSCDAINPSFISQLGGDAGYSIPAPSGSIVVLFNNQRSTMMTVTYDVEITRPGQSEVVSGSFHTNMVQGYIPVTLDCNTTMIKVTGIAPTTGTGVALPGGDSLSLAVNEFRPPALRCGSVLFVNVPVFGSPTAELIP